MRIQATQTKAVTVSINDKQIKAIVAKFLRAEWDLPVNPCTGRIDGNLQVCKTPNGLWSKVRPHRMVEVGDESHIALYNELGLSEEGL